MKRTLKKGGYSAVLTLIVIAAAVVFNMMINKLPESMRRFDMSGRQLYDLGETTEEVLAGLDKDVVIYVVGDPESVDSRITAMANRYAEASDHVQIANRFL